MMHSDVATIRARLTDPAELCRRLGITLSRTRRQARGVYARCVSHADDTPSMSVRVAADGTIAARCMSCGWTGDALGLVAAKHGLDVRHDFRDVLGIAADIAGVTLDTNRPTREPRARATPAPPEQPKYPPADEVAAVWAIARPVGDDAEAADYLASRGLDVDAIELGDLARVLPRDAELPRWASIGRRPWTATGHRLAVPVYDAAGAMHAVRGWRWCDGETPKRLASAGHSVCGLVLADPLARQLFATGAAPTWWPAELPIVVVIAEGEPDYLAWATRTREADEMPPAVLGIPGASAWTAEIAARIPNGARVILRTDHDAAGEKYAAEMARTIGKRCTLLRAKGDA
jgi:DNA primase